MEKRDSHSDKIVEQKRYDERAARVLEANDSLGAYGSLGIRPELRAPYVRYEQLIEKYTHPGAWLLDVCCGNGLHSLTGAARGAIVTTSDIAEKNLELVRTRAEAAGFKINTQVADAEKLPFADGAFDVVTCAGSLSYVDLEIFLSEIRRVLKPGGTFIFVDSFNHNPIYRFNRYIHYLRGNRSKSTLLRMPSKRTLASLRRSFGNFEVEYFGIFSFAMPIMRRLLGEKSAAQLSDRLDRKFNFMRSWAFKIVGKGARVGEAQL